MIIRALPVRAVQGVVANLGAAAQRVVGDGAVALGVGAEGGGVLGLGKSGVAQGDDGKGQIAGNRGLGQGCAMIGSFRW